MSARSFPIPGRLNICLAVMVVMLCSLLLWASGQVQSWWAVAWLALGYSLVMNTGYALCHEAEHDIFHPNPTINDSAGIILTLFFPASFICVARATWDTTCATARTMKRSTCILTEKTRFGSISSFMESLPAGSG